MRNERKESLDLDSLRVIFDVIKDQLQHISGADGYTGCDDKPLLLEVTFTPVHYALTVPGS